MSVIVVALLWVIGISEAARIARGGGAWALTMAVVALAAGRTLDLDSVTAATGAGALTLTIKHFLILVAAFAVVAFTRSIVGPGVKLTPRTVVVAAGPSVLLLVPLLHVSQRLPETEGARMPMYAHDWMWVAHWTGFLAALAGALVLGIGISIRNARYSRGALRARLVVLASGQALGMVYLVVKAARFVVIDAAPELDRPWTAGLEQGALGVGLALIALGLLLGPLGAAWAALVARYRVWVAWPLWTGLWGYAPHLASSPPSRLSAALSRDPRMTLVRVVVEVGDATRALTPYMPPHEPTDPAQRAGALRAAVGRQRDGGEPSNEVVPDERDYTLGERAAELCDTARAWQARSSGRAGGLSPIYL